MGDLPYAGEDPRTGKWRGYVPLMAADIAHLLRVDWECVPVTWANAALALQAGKADVILDLGATPERALVVDFIGPSNRQAFMMITRNGLAGSTWEDFNKPEIRVAVQTGTTNETILKLVAPKATEVGLAPGTDPSLAVSSGRADAFLSTFLTGTIAHAKNPGIGDLVLPTPIVSADSSIAFRYESDPRWRGFLQSWMTYNIKLGVIPKLAFTEAEAEELAASVAAMRAEGATLEMAGANRARQIEPALSASVLAAAWSPCAGYANPLRIAQGFTSALVAAGIEVRLHASVQGIDPGPPFRIQTASGPVRARRLLLAAGVWIGELAGLLGLALPMVCRVSQVTVTERQPPVIGTALGTATDTLSLKEVDNGTVLIGGGWQGIGSPADGPREVIPEHVVGNLRLASAAVPALARARVVRTWLGLEARVADNLPLAGPLPGIPQAWVLGAVHTGFALSPAMAEIMARLILGEAPSVPLFDPARFTAAAVAVHA